MRSKKWTDPLSGITFSADQKKIFIPDGVDTTNIERYIILNYLSVVSGDIKSCAKKEAKPAAEKKPSAVASQPEVPTGEPPKEVVKVCKICGAQFTSQGPLLTHYRTMHPKTK